MAPTLQYNWRSTLPILSLTLPIHVASVSEKGNMFCTRLQQKNLKNIHHIGPTPFAYHFTSSCPPPPHFSLPLNHYLRIIWVFYSDVAGGRQVQDVSFPHTAGEDIRCIDKVVQVNVSNTDRFFRSIFFKNCWGATKKSLHRLKMEDFEKSDTFAMLIDICFW